jgi:hypothetical protein
MKTITICIIILSTAVLGLAGDFSSIQTVLDTEVGGKWMVETNSICPFLTTKVLPPDLKQGTYGIFLAIMGRTPLELARNWMTVCQAPFFILGTNTECVVVTYVPRKHPVSIAIIKALGLNEPTDISPAEAMGLKTMAGVTCAEEDRPISTNNPSDDMALALDIISWVTHGNIKFDKPCDDKAIVSTREEIILVGTPFEKLAKADLIPHGFTVGMNVDRKSINWNKQCLVSMSTKHDDGSYIVNVVVGTLGRSIYKIQVTEHGYQVKLVGMS